MGSLFELVVALAIMMILSFIMFPTWQSFIDHNQTSLSVERIAAAINFARIEAVRRGEAVIFCKSSDHRRCGGEWHEGQLVISASGKVLRILEALPLGDTLIWRSSFARNEVLELLPTGYTLGQQGRFYYRTAKQNQKFMPVLVVNQTGRVRLEYADATSLFSE